VTPHPFYIECHPHFVGSYYNREVMLGDSQMKRFRMEEQGTWLRLIDHLNMGTENHCQGNTKSDVSYHKTGPEAWGLLENHQTTVANSFKEEPEVYCITYNKLVRGWKTQTYYSHRQENFHGWWNGRNTGFTFTAIGKLPRCSEVTICYKVGPISIELLIGMRKWSVAEFRL